MKISIQNVSMTYPNGKQALKELNLELNAPSLIGLLGPNGAGKSTLMKLLVAALIPTSGSILVDGHSLTKTDRSTEQLLKARLGYLPQDFGLFDELTVAQFLDYMAALKGLRDPKGGIREAILAVNLEEKANARIRTLSGGQRQRVGIAQALLGNPSFLIFDEPTVGLDPEERIHFRNLFSRTAQNRLVLLSTHIIEDVQSVCDQLVVINHGRILFVGTPAQLIQAAMGHVGVFWEQEAVWEQGLHITARVNTSQGIRCRAVADTLPACAQPSEPSLEDAYLYLISREVAK
ncbi:ATP-binding cassette domain-containing protein [Candidatus Acetatifactor stercoripullorum]|uniref:ATP-binding cassette domain-containing protein n=1 Tax=Candidatus Acetatifactor stercoripullorum TaxID=2838414 RepID=UPI00298EA4A5|nr:ATP-binding cassette domain-containing protein [Candidatus Acetatifactor stercoripullorum]